MKKLIQFTVIFLLAGFVFSSCSSNLSITKRRYTKGYFVQHHQKTKPAESRSNNKNENQAVSAADKYAPPVLSEVVTAKKLQSHAPALILTAEAPKKVADKHVKTSSNAVPLSVAITNPVKALDTASKLVKTAATGDDALSLLWVVIVVILIIYLLGLLFDGFGLGNLIHILAAIALVLLILWLLRLI
jgi:hypothetical protein